MFRFDLVSDSAIVVEIDGFKVNEVNEEFVRYKMLIMEKGHIRIITTWDGGWLRVSRN